MPSQPQPFWVKAGLQDLGFHETGSRLEEQNGKLRLVVQTTREIWG
jgi:hypothetical protein